MADNKSNDATTAAVSAAKGIVSRRSAGDSNIVDLKYGKHESQGYEDTTGYITGEAFVIEEQSPPPPARTKSVISVVLISALISGIIFSFTTYYVTQSFRDREPVLRPIYPSVINASSAGAPSNFSEVSARVMPSVVSIQVSAPGTRAAGSGSGVVVTGSGEIVTNAHVVTLQGKVSNPEITVVSKGGRRYSAALVGVDTLLDLAVIKIEPGALPPIRFAAAGSVTVGSPVLAVGAPLGLDFTVTQGIISNINRSIQVDSSAPASFYTREKIFIPVIQTDAAINPGNSGGPLVDAAGALIGINVAIGSSRGSSGNIGVGFAIDSDLVSRVVSELMQRGEVSHGYLGVVTADGATADGTYKGALVREVISGTPADKAGLKAGDLVMSIDAVKVSNTTDLTAFVRRYKAGTPITLEVMRGTERLSLTPTLGGVEQLKSQ